MSVLEIWRSGMVRRWHSNPDMADVIDTNRAHQGGCALLVIAMFPDHSHALLIAAVSHDSAEDAVGDLSFYFKAANPEFAAAHAEFESEVLARRALSIDLDEMDRARLWLVDRLDSYLVARHHKPQIMNGSGWPEARETLFDMATELGVLPAMRELGL